MNKKMYKKLKIELSQSHISYQVDKVSVKCDFKMTDPSHVIKGSGDSEDTFRAMGNFSTVIEFPANFEPTKSDILAAVNDLDGVVSTY